MLNNLSLQELDQIISTPINQAKSQNGEKNQDR